MAARKRSKATRTDSSKRSDSPKRYRSPPLAPGTMRADGFRNVLTAIGTAYDKSLYTTFCADHMEWWEAEQLWRGNSFGRKVVELAITDMLRPGLEIKIAGGDKATIEKINAVLEDMLAIEQMMQAGFRESAFGGCAVMPVVNDGRPFWQPLNLEGRVPAVEELQILEARELQASTYYATFGARKFGRPERYRLGATALSAAMGASTSTRPGDRRVGMGTFTEIHESRLIIFPGIVTSREQVIANAGWGESALSRPKKAIHEFGLTFAGVARLMDTFSEGVLGLDQLGELMAEDREDVVQKRIELIDQWRSSLKTWVVDAKDKYERKQTPLGGLGDVMRMFMYVLSSETDIPATKLWGKSPDGMNATGDSDNDNWDDTTANVWTHRFCRPFQQLLRLLFLSNTGPTGGKEPEQWSIERKPSKQPSEKEKQETEKTRAETDKILVESLQVPPEILLRARYGGDTFSYELQMSEQDFKDMAAAQEEQQLAEEEARQAQLEAMKQSAAAGGNEAGELADPEKPAEKSDAVATYKQLRRAAPSPLLIRRTFAGMQICVENPRGSTRTWTQQDGKTGATKMKHDYGFIEGSLGEDGEGVDVYIGKNESAPWAYVVHTMRPPEFDQRDEDKVMLGFDSPTKAVEAYLAHYDDQRFLGGMSMMTVAELKARLETRRSKRIANDKAAR